MGKSNESRAIQQALRKLATKERALVSQRFFKTGKGQYGEGDRFLGVTVPKVRSVIKGHERIDNTELQKLLHSSWHEERLAAAILMGKKFLLVSPVEQQQLVRLYFSEIGKAINNWDLVDTSAFQVLGRYFLERDRTPLHKLAASSNLWERRVAIIATFAFIYRGDPNETLMIAKTLLHDSHDLIQKAVGWMLREVGKRCGKSVLKEFLEPHAKVMPRTMLRYAIEHFSPSERQYYLHKRDA